MNVDVWISKSNCIVTSHVIDYYIFQSKSNCIKNLSQCYLICSCAIIGLCYWSFKRRRVSISKTPLVINSCCLTNNWCIIRSEEHTSELQSRPHLVCRLLLEKKKIDYLRHT